MTLAEGNLLAKVTYKDGIIRLIEDESQHLFVVETIEWQTYEGDYRQNKRVRLSIIK